MEADFTLVPHGGLGNRIQAICSVISYCKKHNKSLKIIWFKDHNLNCTVNKLMFINPILSNVQMVDANFFDLLLRDNPRRKNFWIPKLFQYFLFDKKLYINDVAQVLSYQLKPDFGDLSKYKHIFMVNWGCIWRDSEMWKSIIIDPQIIIKVDEVMKSLNRKRRVGIHVRQTDHWFAIQNSPIELFIKKIQEEIDLYGNNVCFYLASDSLEVKNKIISLFGEKIITSKKKTSRNNKAGIIEAFIEMIVLSKTDKIYASYGSSFSETAHYLSDNEYETVRKNT